jgi:hypothetical protein
MSVFSERPRDMRSQAGDTFDFQRSQREARQTRAPAKGSATGRGRKLGGVETGQVAFAVGAMLSYWLTPALLSRSRPRRRPSGNPQPRP